MHGLGVGYHTGTLAPKDTRAAFRWSLKAGQGGHADSQPMVGQMCRDAVGAPKHIAQSISWYEKVALQGNTLATWESGKILLLGQGTAPDWGNAFQWVVRSATDGHASSSG